KQEGAEIGGSERRSHMADNRATELFDRRNAITFKRVPEGVVRTDEEPFVCAWAENRFHRTGRRAIGIPRPVDARRCTGLPGKVGGSGADQDDLVAGRAISTMANPTAELAISATALTFPTSNHRRTM